MNKPFLAGLAAAAVVTASFAGTAEARCFRVGHHWSCGHHRAHYVAPVSPVLGGFPRPLLLCLRRELSLLRIGVFGIELFRIEPGSSAEQRQPRLTSPRRTGEFEHSGPA
jgi:hypothetical protein